MYNNLGGYKVTELYVKKKYQSYKEETLQHIPVTDYDALVMEKATEYMASARVKRISADPPFVTGVEFDIAKGAAITMDHIISIILYCDMDKYSTQFSETFRKLYSHETMHSVKKRNQEYWWQSKSFIETVEHYGQHGISEKYLDGENGPFCMY